MHEKVRRLLFTVIPFISAVICSPREAMLGRIARQRSGSVSGDKRRSNDGPWKLKSSFQRLTSGTRARRGWLLENRKMGELENRKLESGELKWERDRNGELEIGELTKNWKVEPWRAQEVQRESWKSLELGSGDSESWELESKEIEIKFHFNGQLDFKYCW